MRLTDDQLIKMRDMACDCRPYLPIESDEHAALHDCDVGIYDACVIALEQDDDAETARAYCVMVVNDSPHYARIL